MDKLPQELISKIVDELSIRDATNLLHSFKVRLCQEYDMTTTIHNAHDVYMYDSEYFKVLSESTFATYTKVETCVKEKRSVEKYLDKYFPSGQQLLETMLENDAIISGSRALEFFAVDSVSNNSDWDFFIEYDIPRASNFMYQLTKMGIRWISTIEEFENSLNNCDSEDEIRIDNNKLRFLLKYSRSNNVNKHTKNTIEALVRYVDNEVLPLPESYQSTIKWRKEVLNANGKTKRFCITIADDYIGGSSIVIGGELNYRNKVTKIQLILATIDSHIIDALLGFHISIVQCFINGIMACHMYANDAYSRKSTCWDLNQFSSTSDQSLINKSIKKYEARGYKFYNKSLDSINNPHRQFGTVHRSIGDVNTEIITIKSFSAKSYSKDASKYIEKISDLLNYSWIQHETFVTPKGNASYDVRRNAIRKFHGFLFDAEDSHYDSNTIEYLRGKVHDYSNSNERNTMPLREDISSLALVSISPQHKVLTVDCARFYGLQ